MKKQKRKSGLRAKLIWIVIPIVLCIVFVFFALARDVVLKVSQDKLLSQAQAYSGKISAWTQQIFGELEIYKNTIEEGGFANDAEILAYMETSVDKNKAYPIGLYMGDDNGVYLDGSGWVPDADWVLVERDWYVDGKDNGELAFGEPYYDSMTGDVCVSATVRVDYPKAVRVLATDVYLDYVSGLVTEIAEQSGVGVFLVTGGSNIIIAHPDAEMVAKTLGNEGEDSLYTQIGNAVKAGTQEIIPVQGDSGKYYVALNQVEHTDWYLVTYITEREMLSDLHWMEMYMFIAAVIAAVILIFAILRVTGRVVKPVQAVTDVIGKIAEGDFTQELKVSGKGKDEIAVMSNNMQMFITRMRSTIQEISSTAEWLNQQSGENERVSESLLSSSQSQAEAMELLNKLADELQAAADEAANQMDFLAELIKQTHEDGNVAKELMQESVEMSQSGKEAMEDINAGIESINLSIDTLAKQVTKVDEAMAQIGEMVDIIRDIADETNLLSLNASIEAARAGDAGRGFAVVAEQIGKLATTSSTAVDDIAKLTVDIRNTVGNAVAHMQTSVTEVDRSAGIVSKARETFVELYGKVEKTSRRVEDMIALVEKVDDVAGQMEQITQGQRAAVEQIVDSAKDMNESTENVVHNSGVVADSAAELKKESMELMEEMSRFTV